MKFLSKSMVSVVALSLLWGASVYAMPGGSQEEGDYDQFVTGLIRQVPSPVKAKAKDRERAKAKVLKALQVTVTKKPSTYLAHLMDLFRIKDTNGEFLFDLDERYQCIENLMLFVENPAVNEVLRTAAVRLVVDCLERFLPEQLGD